MFSIPVTSAIDTVLHTRETYHPRRTRLALPLRPPHEYGWMCHVNWVVDQAEVRWDTAKKHLDILVEAGTPLLTAEDTYLPDPTKVNVDMLRAPIHDNSQADPRTEVAAIATRVDGWKTASAIDSIDELGSTLAENRDPEDDSERRRWENRL